MEGGEEGSCRATGPCSGRELGIVNARGASFGARLGVGTFDIYWGESDGIGAGAVPAPLLSVRCRCADT